MLGRVPGKGGVVGGLLGTAGGREAEERQSPSSPLFPGTLPSTLRITFGDLGFLSPVAGGSDLNF